MSLSKLMSLYLLLLGLLFQVACAPPTVAEHPGYMQQSTLDDTHPRARLVLGAESLVGKVRMANVKLRPVGLFTQAQVGIQNLSNKRFHLEYKVEWEDSSGFIVDQSGVWRPFILSPTQIDTITATGKVQEANKIIITIRNPDEPFSFQGEK